MLCKNAEFFVKRVTFRVKQRLNYSDTSYCVGADCNNDATEKGSSRSGVPTPCHRDVKFPRARSNDAALLMSSLAVLELCVQLNHDDQNRTHCCCGSRRVLVDLHSNYSHSWQRHRLMNGAITRRSRTTC